MSSISFQDVKSTLQNNFISLGCSPAAVNQLLTDDFINGIITICEQNQNQYNGEILACVENLNNSPNLSTGKIFHDTFYIEAKKDGIVKDIIEYLNKNINISLSETPTPALLSLQNLNENTSTLNTGDDITIGKGAIVVLGALSIMALVAGGPAGFATFILATVYVGGIFFEFDENGNLRYKEADHLKDIDNYMSTATTARSPLVVDLDGNGVETTTEEDGVYFDHDNNGFAEKTAWVGKDDGLLVRDINNNGQIDDGTELFGNNTVLSSGEKAANGFEALKDLDSNNNNVFDSSDTAWNQVKVWKDANQNGKVDEEELLTLEQAGIENIDLTYQNSSTIDFSGNTVGQTGSFDREDGTQGNINDIWFNIDLMDTIDKTNIDIPADIAALPNVKGFGNVHDLHTAMALDASGELKTLVQQYVAETDSDARQQILYNIIYHWTGVQDMPIDGRDPTQVYGKVIDDTRKLEALEEFMGEEYLGTWCWGERDPNPHGPAAPYILRAFDILAEYVNNELLAQTSYKSLLEDVKLIWNNETETWDVNVSEAVAQIQSVYNENAEEGITNFRAFENLIKNSSYSNLQSVYEAFRSYGSLTGNSLDIMLAKFGYTYGTNLNDNLTGTASVDEINGLDGNDSIYGGAGNDTLDGGTGNDNIFGEDGNDTLIGDEGNDYLIGGNGADTYIFNPGFGNDAIDNSDDNASANEPDIIQFGEGILASKTTLGRQGYDLIITVSYNPDEEGNTRPNDSIRVYSYFDQQGTSSATINSIVFADGTTWDYEYVREHWNSVPGVNGGVTLEGNNDSNTIEGTAYNDILIGNGGNDTINAGNGNDRLLGGTGNDNLNGGYGDDIYLWNWGDGMDTIYDTGNHDKISFGEGISFSDLKFRQEGSHLRITIKDNESQGMLISNFFSNLDYKIEDLYFYDGSIIHLSEIPLVLHQLNTNETINLTGNGDTVYANDGNDRVYGKTGNDTLYGEKGFDSLYGENGNDTLIGGTGNDYMEGGAGDDTYIYNIGDGLDTIYDYENSSTSGYNDKIKFGEGIEFADLSFRRNGNDLIITLFEDITQGIIIKDHFNSNGSIEHLEFSNGPTRNLIGMGFTFQQTDMHDNISGTSYDDVIYGNGGNDTILGEAGNDTIVGGVGNDSLNGGAGNDTYIWNLGDGFDSINDYSGNNTIEFGEGITLDNLTFERGDLSNSSDSDNLYIFVNGDRNQGMKINNFFGSPSYRNFTLKFADGSTFVPSEHGFNYVLPEGQTELQGSSYADTLIGNDYDNELTSINGDDTLIGGKGNDSLYGGDGNDTYIWNLGDGFDYISDYSGNNTIEFGEGITLDNLTFERGDLSNYSDSDNLYIFVNGDRNQGMKINNFFSYKNVTLKFADGSTFVPSEHGFNYVLPEGQTELQGSSYADTLIGNDYDNELNGGDGNDTLIGGKGNDSLYGGDGDDTLIGGKGNDSLYGESGNDTYIWNLGDGFDYIGDYSGNNTIEFGEGITLDNLTFERGDLSNSSDSNDLYIFVNGDRNQGMKISRFFSYQNFTLKFADGSTFVPSEHGFNYTLPETQTELQGSSYTDTLTGNGYDNELNGYNGDDTLIGGKGNDSLYGGDGNDTYIWNLGDGFDYIGDYSGNNTIEFGEGITLDNLTFERGDLSNSSDSNDLYIFVNGDRNQGMKISRFFSYQNFTLKFSDGTTFVPSEHGFNYTLPETQTELQGSSYTDTLTGNGYDNELNGYNGDDTLIGGKGNDSLYGGDGNDTYIWNLGDGFDYINDSNGNNTIEFDEGITLNNLTFERGDLNNYSDSNDLYIFVNGDRNQGMKINNFFGSPSYRNFTLKFANGSTQQLTTDLSLSQLPEVNLTLNGSNDDDILTGGVGHDVINAGDGYNDITGGQGNDTLTGGYDRDTYYYNLGDGFDTISDPSGNDKIVFGDGISKDNVTFKKNGNDLLIVVNNDLTQGIKVINFFSTDDNKIETLKFSDNSSINLATAGLKLEQWNTNDDITGTPYDDIINGNDGSDILHGGSGKDTLIGGKGNDSLYGESGNDTYIWNLGDGFDTIEDNSGQNSIEFGENIDFDDLTFSKIGNNLYITINNNPSEGLNLSQFFSADTYKAFTLKFKNGVQYVLNENGLTLNQGDTADTINATNFNDVIYANDGDDTINTLSGNDIIYGGKGEDIINAGNGNDTVYGNQGNDIIDSGDGNDTLIGGEGNDILTGGNGDDIYIYNLGDGFDTISDSDGNDKIIIGEGISENMLSYCREGDDLRIIINNNKLQGFLLKNHFSTGTSKIENIEFSDGNTLSLINKGFTFNQKNIDETITGTNYNDIINAGNGNDTVNAGEGDDTISGGLGNDSLNGGNGNDTYIYNLNDGFDTINETSGTDKIILGSGISLENLRFIREGSNLRVLINNDISQGFLLINQFANVDAKVEQIQFADDSILDLINDSLTFEQHEGPETINGTDNDDIIYGKGGNDTIYAEDGDDILIGGEGNDTLNGGNGRDIYIYNIGDGSDIINDTRGNDKIKFGNEISQNDLTFTQEENNLRIIIGNDTNQSILINDFYKDTNKQIETLQFANGSTLNLSTQGLTLQQTNADDTINGTPYNDIIYGNGGHDTINAGEGNDTLIGGVGNDVLDGGLGNDIYQYNLGDGFDTISDTGGTDKIVFGEGISQNNLSFERIENNLKISINGDEIKGIMINNQFNADSSKRVEMLEFNDGSTINITNADQLIQAMNSFDAETSSSMDTLSNPIENISDMYNIASGSDLINKTI